MADKIRHGRFVLYQDTEPRPSVRLVHRGKYTDYFRKVNPVKAVAEKVLALVHKNIRSNLNGRWTPIQYGPNAGSNALQNTEHQWHIKYLSPQHARVEPKQRYAKIWRGHMGAASRRPLVITPKRTKSKGKKALLKFICYDGFWLRIPYVRMPVRDPRPMKHQIRSLSNGE